MKKIIFILCLFASITTASPRGQSFEAGKNLDIFHSLYRELEMYYVDTLDAGKVIRRGIDAMLKGLDPYTEYLSEAETEDFKILTTGEYGGIGSMISMDKDQNIIVSEPYEGKPAALSGLKAGDIIVSIDREAMQGKSVSDASEKLKGKAGTKVELVIQRPGEKKPRTIILKRELIQIDAVTYSGILNGENGAKIGYILLNSFTSSSATEVKNAFLNLKKNYGIESLILDLRNNGGGIMEEAIQIVNLFVPKGQLVVSTKGRLKEWERSYRTTIDPVDTVMPLVVLANNYSASASEIVAGALQDLDRAVVLGTRTFGKGLVQSTREVAYDGNLKLTIAKYYIPSGRLIQALDYSHRNPDGSVGRVPDSLTNVFRTANGRPVRDGGGITPDTIVEAEKMPSILYYLVTGNILFDFATEWVAGKESVPAPEVFALTDDDYQAFKAFVKKRGFTYDRQSEKALQNLKETVEFEGYLDTASVEFKALEAKLKPDLDRDLDKFRPAISEQLNEEILQRFYYQKGKVRNALRNNIQVNTAIGILSNREMYNKLLVPGGKK